MISSGWFFRFVQQPAARTIHAPAPYRETLLKIYASLGVTVRWLPRQP